MDTKITKENLQEFATKLHEKNKTVFAPKTIENTVEDLSDTIARIQAAVGSPLVASTAAEMTDTDKVYVYVGSETGYTAGNWYYYDGAAWQSGGVYNAVAIQTDDTLSIEGMAADSKAVGDKLNMITADIYNIQINKETGVYINPNNGNTLNYAGWEASDYIDISLCKNIMYYTGVSSQYNAFYDASKTYISGFTMTAGFLRNSPRTVAVPTGAKYVRISNTTAGFATTFFYPGSALVSLKRSNIFNGLVYGDDIRIKKGASNSLTVEFISASYVETTYYYGDYYYKSIPANTSITIPNKHYLIYNFDDGTLHDMDFSAILNVSNFTHLVMLLYNNNGLPVGIMNPYFKDDESLPAYYDSYLSTKITSVNSAKSGYGRNGFSFFFITDEHAKQNTMQAAKLLKELKASTAIDTIINGGDIITTENDKDSVYYQISKYIAYLESSGCDVYSAIGNHEFNNPSGSSTPEALAKTLSLAEVASVLYQNNNYDDCVFNLTNYVYYKDFNNIRVYFLPCNYASGVYRADVWDIMADMQTLPDDFHMMVVSHCIKEYGDDMSIEPVKTHVQGLLDAMDALKKHTTFIYQGRSFDYSNTTAIPVCMIGGHAHIDHSFTTTGGIPVIMTTCDTYNQECGGLDRTPHTTNEQAFDVVNIDYDAKTITMTRIGAGSDRDFIY